MAELPRVFRNMLSGGAPAQASARFLQVGVATDAVGGEERVASLAALFPRIAFESVGRGWPELLAPDLDILIVPVNAGSEADVSAALHRIATRRPTLQVIVTLFDADVTTTRRLMREGAADVLPAPVSEPALAISLERLFAADRNASNRSRERGGEIVAVIKAGGGVGATALCVQTAAILAARGSGSVCLADLDLQFGDAGIYLDLPEAISISDILASGSALTETPFDTALARHRSGARLLAAPRDVVALESLSPSQADALAAGLRAAFSLTIIDLPSAWTAWTNQILNLADRIVMVTQLSVPHVQAVKRQLRVMSMQHLDSKPLVLVCNALTSEQTATVSIKAAERALGREFDVVIPADSRLMASALNQGVELSAVKRGSKIEKAVAELADAMAAGVLAPARGG